MKWIFLCVLPFFMSGCAWADWAVSNSDTVTATADVVGTVAESVMGPGGKAIVGGTTALALMIAGFFATKRSEQ